MISLSALTRLFFRKTDDELDTISAQAEAVITSGMTSISALSQSASYSPEMAGVVIEAVEAVRSARATNPSACADDLPGPALGHATRFQQTQDPQGVTWGA